MKNREKIVLLICSELSQRWLEYYALDILAEVFDFEYWDCSDILIPGFHYTTKPERNYVLKISSLEQLKQNLQRLPKQTLVIHGAIQEIYANYRFHQYVSTRFPNRCFIDFDLEVNCGDQYEKGAAKYVRNVSLIKKLKRIIYQSDILALLTKIIFHPSKENRKMAIEYYYTRKIRKMYKQTAFITCKTFFEHPYYINHPDVNKYLQVCRSKDHINGRYVAFLDEYFPRHQDFDFCNPDVNRKSLEQPYYQPMNALFDKIEQQYQCEVVIAAHPNSNYTDNPFGGRKIIKHKTSELVRDCIGVCMHAGNALSYVMLYDKPVLIVYSQTFNQFKDFNNLIINTVKENSLQLINSDELPAEIPMEKIPVDKRNAFIAHHFGKVDATMKTNEELIPMHLRSIYHEMYG